MSTLEEPSKRGVNTLKDSVTCHHISLLRETIAIAIDILIRSSVSSRSGLHPRIIMQVLAIEVEGIR